MVRRIKVRRINFEGFKKSEFGYFKTGKSSINKKIKKGKRLSKEDKVYLGRQLSALESKSKGLGDKLKSIGRAFSKASREEYQIERAERYLRVRKKVEKRKAKVAERMQGDLRALRNELKSQNLKLSREFKSTLEDLSRLKSEKGKGRGKTLFSELPHRKEMFNKILSDISSLYLEGSLESGIVKDLTEEKTARAAQKDITFSSIEAQKAKSEDSLKNMMTNLLNLNLVPDFPEGTTRIHRKDFSAKELSIIYGNNNAKKMELVEKHLPLNTAPVISEQAKKYPVMSAMLQGIMKNFEKWDDLVLKRDKRVLEKLKTQLSQQLMNLAVLSDLMSSLTKSSEDSTALALVSPLESFQDTDRKGKPITTPLTLLVGHYMSGKKDLGREENKQLLGLILQQVINNAKADLPKTMSELVIVEESDEESDRELEGELDAESKAELAELEGELDAESKAELAELKAELAELQEKRKQAPVTTKAIQLTAELHKAIRGGKRWAMQQPTLETLGDSANDVFKLKSPEEGGGTTAFFKVGASGEEAAGIMEKMMWDISVVMGIEEMFVPTGQTEVRDASQLSGGEKTTKAWTESGELKEVEGVQKARYGGIQVAQQGMVLEDYLHLTPEERTAQISKSEIIKATGVSLAFGMWDAHGGNIFVTNEGKIRYFDNTRSLPNSNGFIDYGGSGIVTSYRSALLDLPESHDELSTKELNQLKQDVAGYRGKIEGLKKFLNNPQTQAQLKRLPPGWMDLESSIAATVERISLMEIALATRKVKTLQDLVILSNPSYKFALALVFLSLAAKREINVNLLPFEQNLHCGVGFENSNEEVTELASFGFDVKLVKSWCDDPKMRMKDVIKQVRDLYNDRVLLGAPPSTVIQRMMKDAEKINKKLFRNAAYDFKDWNRQYCEGFAMKENVKEFDENDVPFRVSPNIQSSIYWAEKNNNDQLLVRTKSDGKYHVIYKTPTGYHFKDIDIQSNFGMVKVDGKEVTVEKYISSLTKKRTPTYAEIPAMRRSLTKKLLKHAPDGSLQLRKSRDKKSLVVAFKSAGEVREYKFPPGEKKGKFQLEGEDVSIRKIIREVKKDIAANPE